MRTIKKIILLTLTALMMTGCENISTTTDYCIGEKYFIGDCEYVFGGQNFTHAGDCKNCKERRQKKLEELIIKLKEK